MDLDTVIRLAREAGFGFPADHDLTEPTARLERFVALVAEHERNRCAKVFQRRMERVLFNFKEELDACISSVRGEE